MTENNQNPDESNLTYDEDADFPSYANKNNKKLNEIIKKYKKEKRTLNAEIDENNGMVKVLDEHIKSVEVEVKNTQMILEHTRSQIKIEKHTIQSIERQIGKLKNEKKRLADLEVELQERLNSEQNMIFKANERMDKYKLEMNANQEVLEQWALAARQKEDDNLNLEKYKRQDDLKIKELMLQIEKLTIEVNRKALELEKEVTETQAAQIEMEKTTEELRNQQAERQDLLDKLLKTEEQIKQRHEELKTECDKYVKNKINLANMKKDLEGKIDAYNDQLKQVKVINEEHKKEESVLARRRAEFTQQEIDIKELANDIEIKKNELSALARELTMKSNTISMLRTDLENKRKKLDEAKNEFTNRKGGLLLNEDSFKRAKTDEEKSLIQNEELEKRLKHRREELERTVNTLYDKSKDLYKLREDEANMVGEINNNLSAKKNLSANIYKRIQEITKQEELLYNVDFQIQLMERKVAWVQGKRTKEEKEEIDKEIEELEKQISELQEKLKKLKDSLKSIDEDLRKVTNSLKIAEDERGKLTHVIEELELENIMSAQDLQKIISKKEGVLVQHDLMKLEIKKLYDKLVNKANDVFKKENRLFQLELSIKEREQEIQVHKEILVAEHKSAEEERHRAAMELSQKLTKVNNLKLKYESIVQKNKKSGDDESGIGEHSQAYYVIKTAQEREELARQKDEMQGKIRKMQKDRDSLNYTLKNLKERNDRLKDNLISKKSGKLDKAKKEELEDRVKIETQEMWEKKNALNQIKNEIETEKQRLTEKIMENQIMNSKIEEFSPQVEKMKKEIDDVQEKFTRSEKRKKASNDKVKRMKTDNTTLDVEINLYEQKTKNQFLMNAVSILCNEIPELKNAITGSLQEKGISIPSRPNSEKIMTDSNASVRSKK